MGKIHYLVRAEQYFDFEGETEVVGIYHTEKAANEAFAKGVNDAKEVASDVVCDDSQMGGNTQIYTSSCSDYPFVVSESYNEICGVMKDEKYIIHRRKQK